MLRTAAVLTLVFAGCAWADDGAPISAYDKAHMSPQAFGRHMVEQLYEAMALPE